MSHIIGFFFFFSNQLDIPTEKNSLGVLNIYILDDPAESGRIRTPKEIRPKKMISARNGHLPLERQIFNPI